MRHWEVVQVCCALMKGSEEVISYIVHVAKEEIINGGGWVQTHSAISCLQKECGLQKPLFVVYPSCCHTLAEVLNTAKLVAIEDLTDTGEECDLTLPCNADIVIDCQKGLDVTEVRMDEVMKTLHRYRDHIISIEVGNWSHEAMKHLSLLFPLPSLSVLSMYECYIPKEVVCNLAQMHQLTYLKLEASSDDDNDDLASHGDLLVAAIQAWNGQSKLKVVILSSKLPGSVYRPLLAAIAANCPCLQNFNVMNVTLSGCLVQFLRNPPPALKGLFLMNTHLLADDIDSLTTAVTSRRLEHLERVDLRGSNLSEAQVTPLLHAWLNTLGDRLLKLYIGNYFVPVTIAANRNLTPDFYLKCIKQGASLKETHELLYLLNDFSLQK